MLAAYDKILIAVDGSVQSEKAFQEGLEIAKRNDATVYLAWIINDVELATSAYAFSKLLEDEREYIDDFLTKKISDAKSFGLDNVQSIIDVGPPKRKLAIDIPEKFGINLIIMGSTGKGAITQALIGSTTAFVVNHAVCNVLVVK